MPISDLSLLPNRCLIAGEWVGDPQDVIRNPATGETVGSVPHCGPVEAGRAIEAAAQAFVSWSRLVAKDRSIILRRWYDAILAAREDLAILLTCEQGKPLAEARAEIDYAATFIEFYAEEAKRVGGEMLSSHRRDARLLVMRQPIGVVAAITPWNFPAAMITRKAGPALAAGCTMVLKPAPETPLTALALGVLAQRAGLPPGVLNIVTGDAARIGKVLTSHQVVRFVTFTGSTEVGKLLMAQAASTVKKVGLELGGNAPFIVFDDADLDAAVEGAMASKFRNMGQTCVCANRIYVQAGVHDAFVEALTQRVKGLKIGSGLEPDIVQGPLINDEAVDKVERHIGDAVAKGACVVTGGKRHTLGRTFFEPTILTGVTAAMLPAQEETFGPVASIIRFEREEEAIIQANDTTYGLAAYFYTRDLAKAFRVSEALEYGMVGVNSGAISTELAPFGGVKESGIGREGSRHGIDEYLELKYVMMGGMGA